MFPGSKSWAVPLRSDYTEIDNRCQTGSYHIYDYHIYDLIETEFQYVFSGSQLCGQTVNNLRPQKQNIAKPLLHLKLNMSQGGFIFSPLTIQQVYWYSLSTCHRTQDMIIISLTADIFVSDFIRPRRMSASILLRPYRKHGYSRLSPVYIRYRRRCMITSGLTAVMFFSFVDRCQGIIDYRPLLLIGVDCEHTTAKLNSVFVTIFVYKCDKVTNSKSALRTTMRHDKKMSKC